MSKILDYEVEKRSFVPEDATRIVACGVSLCCFGIPLARLVSVVFFLGSLFVLFVFGALVGYFIRHKRIPASKVILLRWTTFILTIFQILLLTLFIKKAIDMLPFDKHKFNQFVSSMNLLWLAICFLLPIMVAAAAALSFQDKKPK